MAEQHHKTFVGLDLLRFAAALLVMSFHLVYWSWAAPFGTTAAALKGAAVFPEIGYLFKDGGVGVEIFFVISGFVIAFTAAGKSPTQFAISRVLRLYPTAIACATITLVFAVTGHVYETVIAKYLKSLLLFPVGPWIDGVYWTLRVELAFYLLIFFVLAVRAFEHIESIAVSLGVWSMTMTAVILLSGEGGHFGLNAGDHPQLYPILIAQIFLIQYGVFFALGVLLWLMTTARSPSRVIFASIFFIGCLVEIGLNGNPITRCLIFTIAMAGFIASLVLNSRASNLSPYQLHTVRLIGLSTYPLYLLHDIVGAVLIRFSVAAGLPRYAALAVSITLVFVMCFAIVGIVEPAVRQFRRSRILSAS